MLVPSFVILSAAKDLNRARTAIQNWSRIVRTAVGAPPSLFEGGFPQG